MISEHSKTKQDHSDALRQITTQHEASLEKERLQLREQLKAMESNYQAQIAALNQELLAKANTVEEAQARLKTDLDLKSK